MRNVQRRSTLEHDTYIIQKSTLDLFGPFEGDDDALDWIEMVDPTGVDEWVITTPSTVEI